MSVKNSVIFQQSSEVLLFAKYLLSRRIMIRILIGIERQKFYIYRYLLQWRPPTARAKHYGILFFSQTTSTKLQLWGRFCQQSSFCCVESNENNAKPYFSNAKCEHSSICREKNVVASPSTTVDKFEKPTDITTDLLPFPLLSRHLPLMISKVFLPAFFCMMVAEPERNENDSQFGRRRLFSSFLRPVSCLGRL